MTTTIHQRAANRVAESDIRELTGDDMSRVSGGGGTTQVMSSLANMRHEMLKAVANNLRA